MRAFSWIFNTCKGSNKMSGLPKKAFWKKFARKTAKICVGHAKNVKREHTIVNFFSNSPVVEKTYATVMDAVGKLDANAVNVGRR